MSLSARSQGQQTGQQEQQFGTFRTRLILAFAAIFVVVMGVVTLPGFMDGPGDATSMAWVASVAAALSVVLAFVVRRVVSPMEGLVEAGERLQGMYDDARHDALSDPLTGLGNHRSFQEEMPRQIEAAREGEYPLSLALIDLDDLKRTNDERGHAAGDRLLAAMGRLIATTMRSGDRGFRIGGDEFAILLPYSDSGGAYASLRRLLAMALGDESATEARPVYSFSAGISTFPELSSDPARVRRQADAALLWAKRHGRTDVQVFDPERHGNADDHRATPEMAAAVADVAQRRALVPRYQPIFDLATGEPLGYEGLVRPDESAGFPDTVSLFVAAEATERTVELDLAAIEAVAAGAGATVAERYLSLNLSPRTLETEQFRVSDVLQVLDRHEIDPRRIVIELTERETIDDMARLQHNLEACRLAGMRIAADDVGAGNAGLRLLSHVQFDIVKIDLSLVQGGVLRDAALGVLRAIRDLAARTGAVLIAEGIETPEQLTVVRNLGITAGQGYLLAMPSTEPNDGPVDLEALEEMDPQQEWVDPRLVVIGLAKDPEQESPETAEKLESLHDMAQTIRQARPRRRRAADRTQESATA